IMGCGKAEESQAAKTAPEAAKPAAEEGDKAVRARLEKDFPDFKDAKIEPSPIPGIYEISTGSVVGYLTGDGEYLFDGSLVELDSKTNLTETRRNDWRKAQVEAIKEQDMLVFEPKKVEHTITVFTDPQCGYCKKFQGDMDGYLAEGIRVRYMFVPIFGDESKKLSQNVWCAKDQKKAMTEIMAGKKIEDKTCDNPLERHVAIAAEMGIRGTPGILAEDGRLLRGYMPPQMLKAELEGKPLEDQAPPKT
ncbi:MAG: DsbC family protein, partial [Burkholderiales bacterium]